MDSRLHSATKKKAILELSFISGDINNILHNERMAGPIVDLYEGKHLGERSGRNKSP